MVRGIRLLRLQPDADLPEYLASVDQLPVRLGHVLIDERAALPVRTDLDWKVAQQLACPAPEVAQ